MLGSPALEVALGLSFIFLLLSLVCTTVMEWIAGRQKRRPRWLNAAMRRLLMDDQLHERFYAHGLIRSMAAGGGEPSYLSSRTFALTVLDLMKQDGNAASGEPRWLQIAVEKLPVPLQEAIRATSLDKEDLASMQERLERWFDDAMERVSGAYKRRVQRNTLLLAAIITVFANADTFSMARRLWRDPVLRAKVVAAAEVKVHEAAGSEQSPQDPEAADGGLSPDEQKMLGDLTGWSKELDHFAVIIKRNREKQTPWQSVYRILLVIAGHLPGWLVTTIAVSLGAPFWFDLLNKFVNVRAAGRSPVENEVAQAKALRS